MKYQVEINVYIENMAAYTQTYGCKTLNEVKERIQKLSLHETVTSITKHYLIYEHSVKLPPSDYVHELTGKECYHQKFKTPKEDICTIKRKDYAHKILKNEQYPNYRFTYNFLKYHETFKYFYKGKAVYDLKKQDKEGTMKALYDHSKSNQIFNLCLYQYKFLPLEEFGIQSL